MMGAPDTDDEWRKAITSALLDGSSIIVIDNVVGKLRSSSLTRALTSKTWRDRFLGKSEMVDLPQRSIWVATGNNIVIGGDLARRSYWIRLDASMARPWLRTGFKHEDLLGWIKANQASLLSDLLIMARAWILAGRPAGSAKSIGGFKEWSDIIGGILEFAGIQGFLTNASELYDTMDQDVQQWDEFLGAWAAIHADHPIGAGQLRDELTSTEQIYRTLQDAMPDDVAEAVRKDRRASLSLGVVLSKHVDQIYPSGRRLRRENDSHSKSSLWKVAGSGEKQESQSGDHFAGSAGSNLLRGSLHKNQSNLLKCIEVELLPALPANQQQETEFQKAQLPANSLCGRRGDGRGPSDLEKSPVFCLVCGDPIGPGHGTYYDKFCASCGPKLPMVRAAAKAHSAGFSLSELWEDLAMRGRPPLKEHLPVMLQDLGCVEVAGRWMKPPQEPEEAARV
jgi:hypothetical protein